MITVIDSGICNLASVTTALDRIGAPWTLGNTPMEIGDAQALILPGVGAFAEGMNSLHQRDLVEPIRAHAASTRPILGICLGMHMLADHSEEFGNHEGLGLISSKVCRLPADQELRLPNIGWCDVRYSSCASLFKGLPQPSCFYFAHSYCLECTDSGDSVATIRWSNTDRTVAVRKGNVYGVQFHPELSQDSGLTVLANFCNHIGELK